MKACPYLLQFYEQQNLQGWILQLVLLRLQLPCLTSTIASYLATYFLCLQARGHFPKMSKNHRAPYASRFLILECNETVEADFFQYSLKFSYAGNWELVKLIVGTKFRRSHVFVYTLKRELDWQLMTWFFFVMVKRQLK